MDTMANTTVDPDVHIVIAACPGYGHVRPLRAPARSLTKLGWPITFIAGTAFRSGLEAVPGVEYVPLKGISDFDMEHLDDYFPSRANLPKEAFMFIWDMEHIFFASMPDQHDVLQGVLKRPELANKKVVFLGDATYTGVMPMALGSPYARRVPTLGVGAIPLIFQSKDTAPFGMGLPSQGEEQNIKLNEGHTQMLAGVEAALERTLEPYKCTKQMHGRNPMDNLCHLHDSYLQLCVPAPEPERSDLPASVKFIGTMLGSNDHRGMPEWFQEFVVEDKSDRPLVMVSSGTLPMMDPSELILPTIEACQYLPVRLVVCAVHASKPADFVLRENVRWAEWIHFEELFKYVSVVVTNGGYGGINQAFASGIPMVLAGLTEDKAETTVRGEMTGAAINLRTQRPNQKQVKEALEKLLNEPKYKEKALKLKEAYAACDPVGSVVKEINEQVAKFYGKANVVIKGHA